AYTLCSLAWSSYCCPANRQTKRTGSTTSQELMRFYAYCLFLDKTVTHARTAKWIPNRNSLDLEGSHYHQKSFTQACRRWVYKFHRKRALPKERRVSSSSLKS